MNAYDFDNTIFTPDSSCLFFLFCLRHYPRAVGKAVPSSVWQLIVYLCSGKKDAKNLKESLFSYLNRIESVEAAVDAFWAENEGNIEAWYLAQKTAYDVVISASPEFLLAPVCNQLGVKLIATKMNPYTGKIQGRNCHDQEKVRRFLEQYAAEDLDEFYSDSLVDSSMARLAKKAFLIKDHRPAPWPVLSAKARKG